MKKTIIFLMVLVLAFSVVGCTNEEEKDDVRIDIPINSIDSIAVDDAEVNDNDLVNEVLSGDGLLDYLASLPDEPEELFSAGCFVITNKGSCYGQNYLETFLEDYGNDVSAVITIGQYTIEGDLILSYIEYDGQQVTLTIDSRRDSFAGNGNLIYTRNSKYFSVMDLPGAGGSIMCLHDDPNMTPEILESILASSTMEIAETYGFYWICSFMLW